MTGSDGAGGWLRRHGLSVAGEMLVNFVAPVLVYDRLAPGHGDVVALFASSIPPALWSPVEFARARRRRRPQPLRRARRDPVRAARR